MEPRMGSMKDRMARSMVERAAADGRLLPGGTVVEYTVGTTGISLGANIVAALRSLGPKATVVTIIVESGLRYLSTDVFARLQL